MWIVSGLNSKKIKLIRTKLLLYFIASSGQLNVWIAFNPLYIDMDEYIESYKHKLFNSDWPLHTMNSCELNMFAYDTHKYVCFSSYFQDICTKLSEFLNGLCRIDIWNVHICSELPNKAIRVLTKSNKRGVGASHFFLLK